jgi:nicotinamidase-related amidase
LSYQNNTPYPPSLKRDQALLLVIDEQGKLFDQTFNHDEIVRTSSIMIRGCQLLHIPILVTEQYPKGLGPTVSIIQEALGSDYKPLEKMTFSCLGDEKIVKAVEQSGRTQLLFIGIESHVCVHQTCVHAIQMGYQVYLIKDAISSRSESNRRIGFEKMQYAGAIPSSAEMALFELMYTAEMEPFKAISKLVR